MARVRLFASLAEAAGAREVEAEGATVADVLHACELRFGRRFAQQLPHCTVWVNGEHATDDSPVGDRDEVAVLPPVSGGQCWHTGQ